LDLPNYESSFRDLSCTGPTFAPPGRTHPNRKSLSHRDFALPYFGAKFCSPTRACQKSRNPTTSSAIWSASFVVRPGPVHLWAFFARKFNWGLPNVRSVTCTLPSSAIQLHLSNCKSGCSSRARTWPTLGPTRAHPPYESRWTYLYLRPTFPLRQEHSHLLSSTFVVQLRDLLGPTQVRSRPSQSVLDPIRLASPTWNPPSPNTSYDWYLHAKRAFTGSAEKILIGATGRPSANRLENGRFWDA
jgi:hypothetical protein